jgi:putative protease
MRREALEILDKERNRFFVRAKKESRVFLAAHHPADRPQLRLRFEKASQIPETPEDAILILPVKEIAAHPDLARRFGSRLWAELPPLVYGSSARDALEQMLHGLPGPVQDVVCSNIGSVYTAQKHGLKVHGGFELNVLNSESAEKYGKMDLEDVLISPELAFAKMRQMKGELPRGAILYGYLPLMKCRACPGKTEKGCGSCTGLTVMTDRTGTEFALICRDKQYSEILNSVPVYVCDRSVPKLDFEELYFTVESAEECRHVLDLYEEKAPADFPRTAGLYFRELL